MKTPFFDSLFDDFGIWEHSDGKKPLVEEGYALDDAARGLILCLVLGRDEQASVLFDYIAKSIQGDEIFGFATDTFDFWGAPASDDAIGQIVWAMGQACHRHFRADEAKVLYAKALTILGRPKFIRGTAYALLGALYVSHDSAAELAADLKARFAKTTHHWPWPEEYLTYGNGIIPYALIRYGTECDDAEAIKLGLDTLTFVDKACRLNHFLGPVGNSGWFSAHSDKPPVYSQQPIDAAYMVWAMMAAHIATGKPKWLAGAREWMDWFEGDNITQLKLYDPETLMCFDGIDAPDRISTHSGAESNICFLLSRWMMEHKRTF
ncbi:hypothetical protein HJC99_00120 [Candidatus Saccharibacteria bacterium]|nr:hypothetical protein [Candidatus Saccharibacteria bacterium]